ncbi:MAG: 30S ribosomal protein S12 methylthiotransferase RimO [Bacillota bacterium]|jgi:ribosomal protein S12 methylthiotransferase
MGIVSLGCAKNLVDSEIMLGQLFRAGWELTFDFTIAELILVNTCGFIQTAKEESIQQILEMAEYKKPEKGSCRYLAVAGCLVQRYAAQLARDLPEVDFWVGLGEIGEITAKIAQSPIGALPALKAPFLNESNLPRFQVTLKHTAYVKIAEGCDHACAYCAIPVIKGGFRSRSMDSVVREVQQLVAAGVREVNLIAQDLTMYGRDLTPSTNLKALLEKIIAVAQPEWIRLLYAYPSGIDRPLLELIAREPSLCKYLDLPLQHINARILKLMNRPDSPGQLREKLELIRRTVPQLVLRTTFIVGFPSETQLEFEELLSFIQTAKFEHLGVFAYSREERTAAYRLQPQIKQAVKEKRKKAVMVLQQGISSRYLTERVGSTERVLVDQILPDGRAVCRSQAFAPDVDGIIYVAGYRGAPGEFIHCRITGSDIYNLSAEVVE